MLEPHVPMAKQACVSCRKQKRKCNKALPACALCERMNRHCDYSDASPAPTSEEFHALNMKVLELESRLNGGNSMVSPPTAYTTPSSNALSASDALGAQIPYNPPQDYAWQGVQNKFPAIAVLDKDTFKSGGYVYFSGQNWNSKLTESLRIAIPKPSLQPPLVSLCLGTLDLEKAREVLATIAVDHERASMTMGGRFL
jgi:hypothetical protein